jgi:hypothetical protein
MIARSDVLKSLGEIHPDKSRTGVDVQLSLSYGATRCYGLASDRIEEG